METIQAIPDYQEGYWVFLWKNLASCEKVIVTFYDWLYLLVIAYLSIQFLLEAQ